MKKHKLAVIILFIIGTLPVAAQDKASSLSSRSPFIMSFSIGPNFNTGGSEHIENDMINGDILDHAQMLLPSSTGG